MTTKRSRALTIRSTKRLGSSQMTSMSTQNATLLRPRPMDQGSSPPSSARRLREHFLPVLSPLLSAAALERLRSGLKEFDSYLEADDLSLEMSAVLLDQRREIEESLSALCANLAHVLRLLDRVHQEIRLPSRQGSEVRTPTPNSDLGIVARTSGSNDPAGPSAHERREAT